MAFTSFGCYSGNVAKECYTLVSNQDFTLESHIDWPQSVVNINGSFSQVWMTKDEIAFIESMIKPT